MTVYRFFFSTNRGGMLGAASTAEFEDDASALAHASVLGRTPDDDAAFVEVWDLARFVGRVAIAV